jgi:sugar lactone lactonase YvrE
VDCTRTPTIAECVAQLCSALPPLPIEATLWVGDAHAPRELSHDAELVMDGEGRLVGVDRTGSVFRQAHDGTRTVLAAKVVRTARALVYLSTGELLIADSGRGMLVAVYPDGQVRTVVPHLDFPSGLEVDARDQVYVSERTGRRIRRVDPRTGTSSVVADRLAFAPAALALSADEAVLYTVDERDGVVYALDRGDRGGYGPPRELVRGGTGTVPTGCALQSAGAVCVERGRVGTCELAEGASELGCVVREPCEGRAVGDNCRGDFFGVGTCVGDASFMQCVEPEPCATLALGTSCIRNLTPGVCTDLPGTGPVCAPLSPCLGGLPGDACQRDDGVSGVCSIVRGSSELQCALVNPCVGRRAGDVCADGRGLCVDDGGGGLFCAADLGPCGGASEGDMCTTLGQSGRCVWSEFGALSCQLELNIAACAGLPEGSACVDQGLDGTCTDDFRGNVYCQVARACAGLDDGDVCRDQATWGYGHCAKTPDGRSYCEPVRPCQGVGLGERCYAPYARGGGVCAPGARAAYCTTPSVSGPCEGATPGSSCTTTEGSPGSCVDAGKGGLVCQVATCGDGVVGALCYGSGKGGQGHCVNDDGDLRCLEQTVCEGRAVGESCESEGQAGRCADDGRGATYCRLPPTCTGLAAGDACSSKDSGLPGLCVARAGGLLVCASPEPCAGRGVGSQCAGRFGASGVCTPSEQGGVLSCTPASDVRAPKALETDACGWLYVSDARSGEVRRYRADGTQGQLVTRTLHGPITSLTWGSRAGGWRERALYLGVRGGASVLEVPLEVAPRQVVRPLATPVAGPDTPPAVDCLGLSPGPRSITELVRPRGYHDVAFSDDGEIIGSDGSALVAVDRQDNLRVYAPVSGAEGIDRLADGTLIVASSEGLVKVSPEGAVVPLAAGVQAYGVTVGPDGLVYAGTNGVLYRVDPSSGSVDTYLDPQTLPEPFAARTINFDVDHSLMYIGSFGDSVYVLPIDAQLNPAGSPRRFVSVQGGGPYFDGLGVDACGNLYVPSYTHSALYRFGPDGEGAMYWDPPELTPYGHGIRFGSGIGGWLADAVYLPQPYDNNTVVELVTGVGKRP